MPQPSASMTLSGSTNNHARKNKSLPRFGILPKILFSFLFLAIIPLLISSWFFITGMKEIGYTALNNTTYMGQAIVDSVSEMGKDITRSSIKQLDIKSTEKIELRTQETARRIADFLYSVDATVKTLSLIPRDPQNYLAFFQANSKKIINPEELIWNKERSQWIPQKTTLTAPGKAYQLEANKTAWHYRAPLPFSYQDIPLFTEVSYYTLDGREQIKIKNGRISQDLKDISLKKNTWCQAEHYFNMAADLAENQLYVSTMIGSYVPFWGGKPGTFNPDNMRDKKAEDFAYAGRENPLGQRFKGIIRWVMPVFEQGKKTGYITAALDHRHIQEFIEHIHPTPEQFTQHPDGGSGNYAFIWDNTHRNIAHARHYFICGYDPETGREIPGWQGTSKMEQLTAGKIPLDCKVLDFAPQCRDWATITSDGGNGSFQILWSGLYKLTTVATIPYRTGLNYNSPGGFGYVTIGANVDDFHKDAIVMQQNIKQNVDANRSLISKSIQASKDLINVRADKDVRIIVFVTLASLVIVIMVSILLTLQLTRPLKKLNQAAQRMRKGHLDQQVTITSNDEVADLTLAFNDMSRHLQETDRIKSEFVTVASHELRTPIHSMLLSVSAIQDGFCGDISEDVRDELWFTREAIARLTRLIDNLLNLSRMESGKIGKTFSSLQPKTIIETAVAEVEELAKTNNHELQCHISADRGITGDGDRLIQALVNLIGNAIKYNQNGGRVIVSCRQTQDATIISIRDNGDGIPKNVQDKIFDKFFQADQFRSQQVGGSGLGLAITKEIIELHNGTITVTSPLPEKDAKDMDLDFKVRKGAEFVVILPFVGPEKNTKKE